MKYLIITCLLFSSCMTYKKASNYILDTGQGAMFCAANFPVKDSIAPVVFNYKPANNTNYQNYIDSLNLAIYLLSSDIKLKEEILNDTGRCCDLARQYVPIIDSLSNIGARLKYIYVPCKPDTITVTNTIYKRDTAKEMEAHARASGSEDEASMWQKIAIFAIIIAVIFGLIIIIKR